MTAKGLVIFFALAMATAAIGAASGPVVGMALSRGAVEIDNSSVYGNANVVSGSVVKTGEAISRLQMRTGASVTLGQKSRARVYADRLVLEQGSSQATAASGFTVEAADLLILASTPESLTRVQFKENNQVLVAALNGSVRISNREGLVLARVTAGNAMVLEPNRGAAQNLSTMSGYLKKENGRFLLPDQSTNLVVELEGKDLDHNLGRRVEVTGVARPTADKQSQVIQVARLNLLEELPPPPDNQTPKLTKAGKAGLSGGMKTLLIVTGTAGAAAGVGIGLANRS